MFDILKNFYYNSIVAVLSLYQKLIFNQLLKPQAYLFLILKYLTKFVDKFKNIWLKQFVYFKAVLFYFQVYIYYINQFFTKKPKFTYFFPSTWYEASILYKKNKINFDKTTFFSSNWFVIYGQLFKTTLLPAVISVLLALVLLDYYSVDFLRQTAVWAVLGFFFFWLMSTFNFFLKRYRFAKFTSAVQRFWKRTNMYFWAIEGFLFGLFFYYFLNSSQEVLYMYDEANLNQQFLPSAILGYQTYLLLLCLIFYSFFITLMLSTFKKHQQFFHLFIMTLLLTYLYLLESYQVYYLLSSFYENVWLFDAEEQLWTLEIETNRLRVRHQYINVLLLLKYWHFMFIYISWIFFVLKSFEKKQVSYTLLAVNNQNLLILFALNILFYVNWLKWLFRRFLDVMYFWFFSTSNDWSILLFFQELIAYVRFTLKQF